MQRKSENDKDFGSSSAGDDEPSGAGSALNIVTQPTFHGSRSASHIGRKPAFGQTCSMKTLLQDGILQTGEKVLTLEYEGRKFHGDLRRDGTIMMRGPDEAPHIYATPVAWANHCCKMLNPESKPLNAWSSIRFRGKRLDSYKLKWYRAQKSNKMSSGIDNAAGSGMGGMAGGGIVGNIMDGVGVNLQNNALNSSIIRNLQNYRQQQQHQQQQQQHQNQSNQQGSSRLMIHNPITNYFPQYENPLKNKKLIKSVLISNNMDNDCKRLVSKSLDQSVDPCLITQQMNNSIDSNNVNNNNNNNIDDMSNNNGEIDNMDNSLEANNQDPVVNGGENIDEDSKNNNITTTNNNNKNKNYKNCNTIKTTVINYEQLGTRGPHNTHNPNTMVKCIPFSAVDRIQPFNVTVSTNALLLVDFHSHLVSGEVAGYLAGSWDANLHVLTITQAFPCRTSLDDEQSAASTEEEIRQDIEKRNLTLVGWYHSHQGKYSNYPTIKDIQNQLEYQITMKECPGGYVPCVGLICSPHDVRTDDDLSPSFQIYWVMPPPEHLANHYGRPMQMYYSVTRDLFLTQDLLLEMRLLANHYSINRSDMVDFNSTYEHNSRITNFGKLSGSIKPKLPKDLQESEYPEEPNIWKAAIDHFWKFLKNLVIPPEESEPKSSQEQEELEEAEGIKKEEEEPISGDLPASEIPSEGVIENEDIEREEEREEGDPAAIVEDDEMVDDIETSKDDIQQQEPELQLQAEAQNEELEEGEEEQGDLDEAEEEEL